MPVNSSIAAELQKAGPSAIIELFELQLVAALHGSSDVYRFHAGTNNLNVSIKFGGNDYRRFPIEATGFEYSGQGQLPRPTLRVANLNSLLSAILLVVNAFNPGNDLTGAKVTRIRTMARFIDGSNFPGGTNPFGTPDSTARMPDEIYYIDRKAMESRDMVEFELASSFDLAGVRAPKRQTIANVCQWIYRGAECGYTDTRYFDANDNPVASAAQDVCGKRLTSCKKRFGFVGNLGPANPFLTRGNYLDVGQFIISNNGWYRAGIIPEGNFCVISKAGRIIFRVPSAPVGFATRLYMQNDGNLVLYNAANISPGGAVWSTGTNGSGAEQLVLTADGNLVLYNFALTQSYWQSLSGQGTTEPAVSSPPLPFGSFPSVGGFQ